MLTKMLLKVVYFRLRWRSGFLNHLIADSRLLFEESDLALPARVRPDATSKTILAGA